MRSLKSPPKKAGLVTRDAREVERKQVGFRKARVVASSSRSVNRFRASERPPSGGFCHPARPWYLRLCAGPAQAGCSFPLQGASMIKAGVGGYRLHGCGASAVCWRSIRRSRSVRPRLMPGCQEQHVPQPAPAGRSALGRPGSLPIAARDAGCSSPPQRDCNAAGCRAW